MRNEARLAGLAWWSGSTSAVCAMTAAMANKITATARLRRTNSFLNAAQIRHVRVSVSRTAFVFRLAGVSLSPNYSYTTER